MDRPTWDDASDTTMTIATPDIPDLQSPFNFPVGANTTVTYRITDAYDNTANCSISVYIEGNERENESCLICSFIIPCVTKVVFLCRIIAHLCDF